MFSSMSPAMPSPSPVSSSSIFPSVNNSSTTTDFESLFPGVPRSSAEASTQDPLAIAGSAAPWRNKHMRPQSRLVETLRKSVYQRDPVSTWWPLYEQVTEHWRKGPTSESVTDQEASLVRSDFMRFIGALKVSTFSTSASGRLEKLERIFEDFHLVIKTPKSNVRVYNAFFNTLQFWKMGELLPQWTQRIKSRAPNMESLTPMNVTSSIRESTQEHYHDLLRVLAGTNQIEAMTECLEELKTGHARQLRPSVMAYDMILGAYMKRKDTESAMRIFQEMQDQGLSPQLTTFNVLLEGHLENRDAQAAQRVLESLLLANIQPNIYTFNVLMSGYLNMGEIETVNGFYKGLGEYGLAPNSRTYRTLMKSHSRQGHVDRVVSLFCKLKDSPKAELHPGPEDYCVLVQALASHGRMPDALRVLRELKEAADVRITTPIYNVFLNQYAREGQVEKARRILDQIMLEKLPLVDGSVNPLIRAYLGQGNFDKVEEMTKLMSRYGVQLSRTTYNIMINATKCSGNTSGATKMYKRMLEDGVEPDVWTFNILLDILISRLSPNQQGSHRKKVSSSVAEEQIEEYMPQIETLLQEMRSRGIKPDVVTYGKLIHQYVLLRNMEQAETLFHEMLKSGITPNEYVFNTLMNGFTVAEDMEKALELFRRMPKYGVEADATTFTTLIKGYANVRLFTLAQDFANSLQQRSSRISMDQHCFHVLMQLAQKTQNPGMALDFFEMMRGRGIEPDKVTFTILLETLSKEFADASSPSKTRSDSVGGRDRRGLTGHRQSDSAAEAVESLLAVIQQDTFPLDPSEVTTVISAYFRLGRPLAAIEFFKSSLWRENPRLNTTNCGALFHGLLSPVYNGRYDGIVLNLYARMLIGTKEVIRMQQENRKQTLNGTNEGSIHTNWKVEDAQGTKDTPTSWSSSSYPVTGPPVPRSTASQLPQHKTVFVLPNDFPTLDLISINILFQAFSKRNNWKIVLRLWQDLESIGPENLYPFEMPLEFLGWAAQAYHMTTPIEPFWSSDPIHTRSGSSSQHSKEVHQEDKSHEKQAEKLLRQLWTSHHQMGVTWSTRIYGYSIFDPHAASNISKTTTTHRPSVHSRPPSSTSPSPYSSNGREKDD
ncbi:hypothetical protein BGX31_001030 [Mortierella sp. GBA43]|nr:hypothetical protein BGX31_001030 [Mortierella sp. GBA43]